MPAKRVKAWVLKSGVYLDGVPRVAGEEVQVPEDVIGDWLRLGLASLELPAVVTLKGEMHKFGLDEADVEKMAPAMEDFDASLGMTLEEAVDVLSDQVPEEPEPEELPKEKPARRKSKSGDEV